MDVRLIYQHYQHNMSLFINQQPIGSVSSLSKYQTLDFVDWVNDILPAIAYEVNDEFRLTYVGRASEYEILRQMLPKVRECRDIVYEQPVIPDSAINRLKRLSRMVVNGMECSRFVYHIDFFTDIHAEAAENIVKAVLPQLSYCRFDLSIQPLERYKTAQARDHAFALVSRNVPQAIKRELSCMVRGIIDTSLNACSIENNCLFLPATPEAPSEMLSNLFELVMYPSLLSDAIKHCNVQPGNAYFQEYFMLDKTDSQVFVKLPKSIEYGMSSKVQIATYPPSGKTPHISFKISNPSVITAEGTELKAVGTGEVVVEVYTEGSIVPLTSGRITAFRSNWIQNLSIQPDSVKMCVGEVTNLQCSFSPEDADDQKRIKLLSTDGTIAVPQNMTQVVARKPGFTNIWYEAERVKSNQCGVTVYPKLESLKITMDDSRVEVGSMTAVKVERVPADATLDKLSFTVSPSFLGTYDTGSNRFFARTSGSGTITVTSDRNGVKNTFSISIHEKPTKWIKPMLKAAAFIIGGIAVISFISSLMH